MAVNTYRCDEHGEMELTFRAGSPPKECPRCARPLDLVPGLFELQGKGWFKPGYDLQTDKYLESPADYHRMMREGNLERAEKPEDVPES